MQKINNAFDKTYRIFLSCRRGIENLLCKELLLDFGYSNDRIIKTKCGVFLKSSNYLDVYKINYCSRLASRVLLEVGNFECNGREEFVSNVRLIDWSDLLNDYDTYVVRVHPFKKNVHMNFNSTNFVAQITKDGISNFYTNSKKTTFPSVNLKEASKQIRVFVQNENEISIFIDTSGKPLNSSLNKNSLAYSLDSDLANAFLSHCDFVPHPSHKVIDPLCGSGSILIAAALRASKTAPGVFRDNWTFLRIPILYNEKEWKTFVKCINKQKQNFDLNHRRFFKNSFIGCDIHWSSVANCIKHAETAQVSDMLTVFHTDFSKRSPLNNLKISSSCTLNAKNYFFANLPYYTSKKMDSNCRAYLSRLHFNNENHLKRDDNLYEIAAEKSRKEYCPENREDLNVHREVSVVAEKAEVNECFYPKKRNYSELSFKGNYEQIKENRNSSISVKQNVNTDDISSKNRVQKCHENRKREENNSNIIVSREDDKDEITLASIEANEQMLGNVNKEEASMVCLKANPKQAALLRKLSTFISENATESGCYGGILLGVETTPEDIKRNFKIPLFGGKFLLRGSVPAVMYNFKNKF